MSVRQLKKFIPSINGPKNGIVRYLYPNDNSTFSLNSSWFHPEGRYPTLYNTAMLNVSKDFSQFYANKFKTIWVDVKFKNLLYLTHVSYISKQVDNLAWHYATDFSISGTDELNQNITIFRNNDPSYLNKSEPVVIPVRPGIYKSIRFEQIDLSIEFLTIQYLDLFDAICNPVSACYGNPLHIICSCPVNYFQIFSVSVSIFFTFLLN